MIQVMSSFSCFSRIRALILCSVSGFIRSSPSTFLTPRLTRNSWQFKMSRFNSDKPWWIFPWKNCRSFTIQFILSNSTYLKILFWNFYIIRGHRENRMPTSSAYSSLKCFSISGISPFLMSTLLQRYWIIIALMCRLIS